MGVSGDGLARIFFALGYFDCWFLLLLGFFWREWEEWLFLFVRGKANGRMR